MGGSSQGTTQRVVNETKVDPVTQQWRQQIMNRGNSLMSQGLPAFYPGNTVAPFSQQTTQGLDYLQNYASQGAPNFNAANDAASRGLSGFNPANDYAANAAGGGLSNNPWSSMLSQYGSGENPHLRSMFDQGAGQIANAVNSNFAQAGRYGSSAHGGAMTRELGNLWSSIAMPAYESERNRGLTAAQTGGSLWDNAQNRTLAGIDLFGGLHSQGNQDAARSMALLPQLYSYGLMPGQNMLDVGSIYEGQNQANIDANRERYDYNAQGPWNMLERYAGLMSGLPSFNSNSTTTTGPGPDRLMQGLGAAGSLASIFAAFSDRRLKREVEPIGADANGLPWYSYRYLWDAPNVRRVGVMADEAPPHAVSQHPSGFLVVDYAAL